MLDKRSVLKQGQIDILKLLYTHRFGSRQLIANSLGVKPNSLYRKLEVLIKHELVAKRHEPRLKLTGVPAAYYLTPKGLRALQALPEYEHIDDSVIKTSYKDKSVSQAFVNQTMLVYSQVSHLKDHYPTLKTYLRRDMARYSYFPKPLPDVFLSLPTNKDTPPRRYFLDIVPDSQPTKALYQRMVIYLTFLEEGGWDPVSPQPPIILLLGETGTSERRIQRTVKAAIRSVDADADPTICTSTVQAIAHLSGDGAIWTSLDEPDELLALPGL